ncbi:crosslink repair DNA glycosylase YcaQ family protein [Nocardioides sp.]|uniref:DNA glycosylase AlkZ-like family protein n=1 Tax=Nocardioides sp. TaxID=35761 RepID=UPI002734DDB2|nr:crosslink repair DNA glycosylase YcaQ family protein [Nocardioides sp.]MDP3890540.1 crosslink repair DNA glycosylase YcaQ family protein [Nocardioides sp.]
MHRLTREQARRVAVRAQLLDARTDRLDLVQVVERLTLLQIDPVSAIAPSADLVLWSRLGPSYDPADLVAALEEDRSLVELGSYVRAMSDIGLHLAGAADWPHEGTYPGPGGHTWLEDNEPFRVDVLERLETDGPLTSRELPDTCVRPWRSTGWTNNRNVTQLLEFLLQRGEVAVSGRRKRERLWDLAERVYPDGFADLSYAEGQRALGPRRLAALGIARSKSVRVPLEPNDVGEVGEPAEVDGVKGVWRVDPELLERRDEELDGRTALLSPYDRLVYDRTRALELFDFEYTLEMYKPAAKRRWGYYALPILHGDRLVGKVDATADRKAGVLFVDAIHEDVRFNRAIRSGVQDELESLARWLQVDLSLTPPGQPRG